MCHQLERESKKREREKNTEKQREGGEDVGLQLAPYDEAFLKRSTAEAGWKITSILFLLKELHLLRTGVG